MARVRSPEKRSAILQAAVHEISELGLGAPTAKIARRAGVAAGTLFSVEQLKCLDGASRIELGFPHSLYEREMVRAIRYGGTRDRLLL